MNIELLEARIAPAAASVEYVDIDGDKVKITASTGPINLLVIPDGQLKLLNLDDPGFQGANITFTVTKVPGGDGLADVGRINAGMHDLGSVTVKGDLGVIDAGDPSNPALGVKSLTVRSMGRFGLLTQAGSPDLVSDIAGGIGAIKIAGDVKDAKISVTGGGIASLTIGGSLIGGTGAESGRIVATGDIGAVKITGDISGGEGGSSASIRSGGKLTSLTVGGSLFGIGGDSARISSAGDMGMVKIGRDMAGISGGSGSIVATGKLAGVTIGGSLGGGGTGSGEVRGDGAVGAVIIGGSVYGGQGDFSGRLRGASFTSVKVGGSFFGNVGMDSGGIVCNGAMGPLTIGHNLQGGSGITSGKIFIGGDATTISIGGSILGASGTGSGQLEVFGKAKSVKTGFDLVGGFDTKAGRIGINGKVDSLTIGGTVFGGTAPQTGEISVGGDIVALKIGRDLRGGSIFGNSGLDRSGHVESTGGRIGTVMIGGSMIAGLDESATVGADLTKNASIRAQNDIGSVTIKGSMIGTSTPNGTTFATIAARGQAVVAQGSTKDVAIGSLNVSGRMEFARVLAGFNLDNGATGLNGNAQIGKVTVGQDWIASSISAGILDGGAAGFGTTGDSVINNANDAILSKIASVLIKGVIFGSTAMNDHFGFTAQQIGSVKALGFTAALTTGPAADAPIELSPLTADVTIREV